MRQTQRAVSIDNISFITSAMEDRHHSTAKDSNFSTLNNSNHSNHSHNNTSHNSNNSNNYHTNHKTNDDMRNNNHSNHNTLTHQNNNTTNPNNNHSTPINASTDNLHKASDDEPDHIIPWRAQLRKTNSRLSLVGWSDSEWQSFKSFKKFTIGENTQRVIIILLNSNSYLAT